MPTVQVHVLPEFVDPAVLPGAAAVIIDVLRASTTIIHALGHGASSVLPCLTVEDARQAASRVPASQRLLGGERGGEKISGFDLGNSPLDYTPQRVAGRTIVFTTTNGTRALLRCAAAEAVLVGAFVNRAAIVRALQNFGRNVHLVCAGTDGRMTAEDLLFAGAVAGDLLAADRAWTAPDVQTRMAVDYSTARSTDPDRFREAFSGSLGARNLLELGMAADVDRAMQTDLFAIAPRWEADAGVITASEF